MEAPPDPRIGVLLEGRYKILDRLAAGSMGIVYKGERVNLGRPVAIKFLHATFAADKELLRRFELEAIAMSRLGHPHCVSVMDFGVHDGAPFIVLDFVTGKTLREVLENGRLPVNRALNIMRQLLAGLHHAHGQGIVHRDVKPANIMLTEATGTGDHVRILDFGLAKLRSPGGGGSLDQSIAMAVGTPSYMSPEQCRGGTVDGRSDVYSAGVLLFELLTGEKPFVADDTYELLQMHIHRPSPPLRNVAPDAGYSTALEGVVQRALAKEAEQRFQTAGEFAEALEGTPEAGARMARGSTHLPVPGVPGAIPTEIGFAKTETMPKPDLSPAPSGRADSNFDFPPPPRLQTAPPPSDTSGTLARLKGPGASRTVVFILAVGALAAGAWWAFLRNEGEGQGSVPEEASSRVSRPAPSIAPTRGSATPSPPGGPSPSVPPPAAPTTVVAPEAVVDAAAAELVVPTPPLPIDAAPEPPPPVAAASPPDAATPDAAAAAAPPAPEVVEENLGLPPDEQEDPVPAVAEDKDIKDEQIDQKRPRPAVRPADKSVDSVAEVHALLRAGKREEAIDGLELLRRKNPKSAYIPYLLGNLYFEKMWWTDGMQSYSAAIKNNRAYRGRGVLNRNVIRALGSAKTVTRASWLLRKVIGKPSVPYLRQAAKTDKNPKVRARAAAILKRLTPPPKRRSKRGHFR